MNIKNEVPIYCLGREMRKLLEPYKYHDQSFGSDRLDGKTIENADLKHCTFANISFKQTVFQNAEFLNCIFIGCYFRRAEIINSRFIGCKFKDCNFSHIAIKSCDFRHSSFNGCQISYSEILHSLPSEPNLREELARNLALESSLLGLSSESRKYRMLEIRAREEHLIAAVLCKSQWYKDHFDFFSRSRSLIQLVMSYINRHLWGYGEKSWVLIRNLLISSLLLFPLIFYFLQHDLSCSYGSINFWGTVVFSIENILPIEFNSGITAIGTLTKLFAGLEAFFGIVAIALFASYIFRWSLHK